MRLGIIIVNFRTAELTCNCLHSLIPEIKTDESHVVVVDNNSEDHSAKQISDVIKTCGFNKLVSVLPLEHNGGFAFGNNRALEKIFNSHPDVEYIWLLNPDTLVRKNACRALVDFLKDHPTVGIVGSRLEDSDGTLQVSAFRHHSVVSEFLAGMRLGILDKLLSKWLVAQVPVTSASCKTEWVAGASMMVRREVFDQIGLLDEGYFMYFEEEDFCKAAKDAEWPCWYVPESRVVHLVGAASGFSDSRKTQPRRPRYWFESRRRFFLKNYGAANLFFADIAWMLGFIMWRIRRLIQKKPDNDPPYYFRDFLKHSVFCNGFRRQ